MAEDPVGVQVLGQRLAAVQRRRHSPRCPSAGPFDPGVVPGDQGGQVGRDRLGLGERSEPGLAVAERLDETSAPLLTTVQSSGAITLRANSAFRSGCSKLANIRRASAGLELGVQVGALVRRVDEAVQALTGAAVAAVRRCTRTCAVRRSACSGSRESANDPGSRSTPSRRADSTWSAIRSTCRSAVRGGVEGDAWCRCGTARLRVLDLRPLRSISTAYAVRVESARPGAWSRPGSGCRETCRNLRRRTGLRHRRWPTRLTWVRSGRRRPTRSRR